MSLINQMLLDLEKRGVVLDKGEGETTVRPVAPTGKGRGLVLLGLAGLVAFSAWAVWRPLQPAREASPGASERAAAPAAAPQVPAVTPRSNEAMSLRLSAVPSLAAPKEPQRTARTPAGSEPKTRPSVPVAAAAPAHSGVPAKTAAKAEPAAPKAAEAEAPVGAGESSIDKKLKELTPQQQAENAFRKAVGLMQQGRIHDAMEGCAAALQFDSRHAAARQMLVALQVENGRAVEAEGVLEEGVRLKPDYPPFAMALARLQVERGALQGAMETLERSAPYAAGDPDYQGFMGSVLQRLSRHREAAEHYLAAVRLVPQSGVWLMGLGISLQAENRLAEAREAFQLAKASNSLSPELVGFVDQRLAQLERR